MSEGVARGVRGHETARRIVLVDCEASSLAQPGVRSFPIEIAVGVPETGEIRSWLIKPEREWIDEWDWDPGAERVHGLSRDYLLGHGLPRAQVAREVREAIGPREIMSDNPPYEAHWLAVLWGEAKPPQVGSLLILYAAIAGFGEHGRAMFELAEQRALKEAPPKHRAADDVRHELVKLRELLRLADGDGWLEER